MKTVLLKFSGPLQSWGTNSHFEIRHTDSHPSKSGVIGMIAAGLGYRREEDDKIKRLNKLIFAVRVDQNGQILRDYQTVKKYEKDGSIKKNGNYVTDRYYLQDAVFVVALSSEDVELINDVISAVKNPYFPIYLGRRSLPPTADLYLGTVDTDAISALKDYPWQASDQYQRTGNKRLQIFADASLIEGGSNRIRNDEPLSFSQKKGRKFSPRRETSIFIDAVVSRDQKEHDAFGAIRE